MRRPSAIVLVAALLLASAVIAIAWFAGPRRTATSAVDEARPPSGPAPLVGTAPPSRSEALFRPGASTPRRGLTARAADEQHLEQIRALVRSDPAKAEAWARQARTRFPESPHADEWDALLVDALVNQQRIGAARSETYYYYDHHPGGTFTAHLFALTGVHPTRVAPGSQ